MFARASRFARAFLFAIPALAMALGAAQNALAKSYIIQLDRPSAARFVAQERQSGSVSDAAVQAYRDELTADQDRFLAALDDRGINYTLETIDVPDFDGNTQSVEVRYSLVFNGLAIDIPESSRTAVANMAGVKAVHDNRYMFTHLDRSVDYIRAPEVYGDIAELSQFDDHREGFEGQGQIIAVIDSGIDWSHPMFGGDATPPRLGLSPNNAAADTNEKVIYYLPLADAVEDLFGHGTHVSADAAGYRGFTFGPDGLPNTADDVPIHGVAPQARLMGYQVCSGIGSTTATFGCPTATIILSIEDAVSPRTLTGFSKPVADVINLSLGGPGGPNSATSMATDNATLLGTSVVASAGNSGPGEGTIGAPSAGERTISVGAGTDPGNAPNRIDAPADDPDSRLIIADFAPDSNAQQGFNDPITNNYVFAGFADTPDQVPASVLGNICLTERGSTASAADQGTGLFALKAANCQAAGAVAMVLFNNEPGRPGPILAPSGIPVFSISRADGQFLLDLGFDATGVSDEQIRLGLTDPDLFEPTLTGFSSRGPVAGFGQVKPDLFGPGLNILSAATLTGLPVLAISDPSRYAEASGTSFSGPQVAGAAALVRQAHTGFDPDMVRTALMNSSTNARFIDGSPKADGLGADSIIDQGAGLVDVEQAVNVKALMGVAGDGVDSPTILGSHSFGEVPVVNSRVTHTEQVTVTLRDVAAEGGTYNLRIANNRDLQLAGIDASLSTDSVTLPSDGSVTFDVGATVDGDQVRDVFAAKASGNTINFERIQMQYYVIAERSDGGETLRMPFYLRPVASRPAVGAGNSNTREFTGTIAAGDANSEVLGGGVTFQDHELEVPAGSLSISAELEFDQIVDGNVPDLDLFLLDPNGEEVASSTNPGGPESLTHRPQQTGTFTYRVTGFIAAATDYTLTSTQVLGAEPPQLEAFAGDFVDSQDRAIDFDGDFTVDWTANGGEEAFEVEISENGGPFEVIGQTDGGTTSLDVSRPNGEYAFRVKALFPGEIGFFVTMPSNEETIVVDQRQMVDITDQVSSQVSNVNFDGSIFEFDLSLTNDSSTAYVPLIEFNVVNIDSNSGTVEVINADNGGSGTSPEDPALFDYSRQIGGDDTFSGGETTDTRHLEFRDEQAELFTFDALVTGFQRTGSSSSAGSAGTTSSSGGGTDSGSTGTDDSTSLLQFTVNPLTGAVQVELVDVEGLL